MRTYLGPWVEDNVGGERGWRPPTGCIGGVDLRTLPQMSQLGITPGIGLFVCESVLPSEYALLGEGDPAEVRTTGRLRSLWASLAGFAPQGDTLDALLIDHLTRGADPEGLSAPKPLMPSKRGRGHWLELHLHRNVRNRPFAFGEDATDTERVRDMLRREFRGYFHDAGMGRLRDASHHLRILDYWCEQYGLDDWQAFVPPDLRPHVPGRLKHETTLNESWPTNSSTISSGQDLTWTETSGDLEVRGGRLGEVGENGFGEARAEHDLSSVDHYSQCLIYDLATGTAGRTVRTLVRFSASDRTHYGYMVEPSAVSHSLFKRIAGAFTTLTFTALSVPSDGSLMKGEVAGSSLMGTTGSSISITDTAISGGVRCGAACQLECEQDTWEASDGGAVGILYTQLEGGIRGVERGVYMRFD